MTDTSARDTVLDWLRAIEPAIWSILGRLAETPEDLRRRILRPHADASFEGHDPHTLLRRDLDRALAPLMQVETGCQLGVVTVDDAFQAIPPEVRKHLSTLFGSPAFLRYCNAYSYFGIRFLAGRIDPPEWLSSTFNGRLFREPDPVQGNANARPFALVTPPEIDECAAAGELFVERIAQRTTPDMDTALEFLDDFVDDSAEAKHLELWLRGLRPAVDAETARFMNIAEGMFDWAVATAQCYLKLESASPAGWSAAGLMEGSRDRLVRGWVATNPAVPRLALVDMYYIARVLRAEVSPNATVTYSGRSWLNLLCSLTALRERSMDKLRDAEEILRSVFDFVCDLVQNADEITARREGRAYEPESSPSRPERTVEWRATFDEELATIEHQRRLRQFLDSVSPTSENRSDGWAERIKSGRQPPDLFGLAFSGGGIRSATFNLGVLQGLQECDLLRQVDYLSTVSGGGFIGSWLVGSVARTTHWLGRSTNWDDSIAHLRRYSNYLAPRKGVLAPDIWTMWATWARNAFLIQITAVTWLSVLLLIVFTGKAAFVRVGQHPLAPLAATIVTAVAIGVLIASFLDLRSSDVKQNPRAVKGRGLFSGKWIHRGAVWPIWISSIIAASILWHQALERAGRPASGPLATTYSGLLLEMWRPWSISLVVFFFALLFLAFATLWRKRHDAVWISAAALAAFYLQLCGILRLFASWTGDPDRFQWYAYVFGPPLVLTAATISLVLFIGLCGRHSNEPIREWWTRFGALVGSYAVTILGLAGAAVFGPVLVVALYTAGNKWVKGAAVASWVGTVIAGLVAGQSSKTTGSDKESSRNLQLLARVAGVLFIVGGVFSVAIAVYVVLILAGTDADAIEAVRLYWPHLAKIHARTPLVALLVVLPAGVLFSWCFEINIFGLNQFYRNRLVRCYLGATRWVTGLRRPIPFTQFDRLDDMKLSALSGTYRGPFPIFNCALNLGGSRDLSVHTRHSASFSLTPLRCGSSRPRVGYAPTISEPDGHQKREFSGGVMLGQAVAISGAAASPNMGYNTSPLVAFLLTMFNVRLGWWFPNPGKEYWDSSGLRFSLYYLLDELLGSADENNRFVNVSDGGHFENLGVYELVRRRCKVILACDAECDPSLEFGSLGNLVRLCETDFGARIDLDVSSIRRQGVGNNSRAHCAVGTITYSNGSVGYLIYVKASLTGDEPIGVAQYQSAHATFPHETTADQFFAETQFESYRRLGQHVIQKVLSGCDTAQPPVEIAVRLRDVWAPAGFLNESFIKHTTALDALWERMRQSQELHHFMNELSGRSAPAEPLTLHERSVGLELIQLMENAFLDLRLDDFWEHPDNRGWVMLLSGWAKSPRFRAVWNDSRSIFGIRFEYFCESRLGLPAGRPVVRL